MDRLLRKWRWRRARRELVGDLVTRLDGANDLEGVLRETLGDHHLRVGYSLDGGTRFVSATGEPVVVPDEDDSDTLVTPLTHDGRLIAVVVHDRALAGDDALFAGVAGAAGLAAANARLAVELEASVAEIRRSRARLVAAGDAARRQVERDLHDGAQQRLVALALDTRLALLDAGDPAVRAALERAGEQLQAALTELRELARGLYPAALPEHGLATAVSALAERVGARLELDVRPGERFPADMEASAYFCIAAAVAASDGPLNVAIARIERVVRVQVAGVALADDHLQHLRDRIEALGGTLDASGAKGFAFVVPISGG